MARTVITAFDDFQKNVINLDSEVTNMARKSRDWLMKQINDFPIKDITFPELYSEKNIYSGSFARKTKIRELDDIDLMIAFSAAYGSYYEIYYDHVKIFVTDNKLSAFCNDGTNVLNSRKIINKIISRLRQVSQYGSANVKRNQEAVTLKLATYIWNFDIVPCFFTQKDHYDKDYYLIPDGDGNWKKTDPRIDAKRSSIINQYHDGNVLNVIRIIKFWNTRPTMPSIPSYLLENMILNYYENNSSKASPYVDIEIEKILGHISIVIFYDLDDPKGIQGDLNKLSYAEKLKISNRANIDYQKAIEARNFESNGENERSIRKWKEIFGPSFY
ncbi:nucleotidyltransferase [Paenibacillus sp. FSL H7-0331]|uniref:nucleotidyltransferase n=1 Tax=Paenibacillus sp. FSL H7-0331 TaxID=1920421 RepID=UPI00096E2F52|nr:nucleotidyltransferase [Paenibacillus sp. FSL H7-0331]OMF04872.1 nucleotidyltransferase [Paenibacillus sp. FSL H7-0331]